MRPFGDSKTLSAVEIEETRIDPATGEHVSTKRIFAADEEVIQEVVKFQKDVFASKGNLDTAKFRQKWRFQAPNTNNDECRQKAERMPEPKELLEAMQKAAKGKSTGSDNTPVEIICQLTKKDPDSPAFQILFQLILAIWNGEDLPVSWRTGQMILIYKDGAQTSIANYRPITLLQAAYKLHSHILCSRATAFIEERRILSPAQYGFRAGRSTAHALFATTEAIRTALKTNKALHVVYVDFKKAFDSIEHDLLDTVLDESFYGIPPVLGDALRQTYRRRQIAMKIEQGDSDPFPIDRGVPQGDPLSPLLFILAINPLLEALDQLAGADIHGVNYPAGAYCDDLTLYANSTLDIMTLWNKLAEFSDDSLLRINPKKTDYSTNRLVGPAEQAPLAFENVLVTHQDGNVALRSLGVWLSLNGDSSTQKSRASGLLQADIVRLQSKSITDLQFLDVLKKMTLPKIAYSLGCVEYSADELKALQTRIEMSITRRLHLPDRFYSDWIQMDTKLGGLGIPSIQTIYACQKVATPPTNSARPNVKSTTDSHGTIARDNDSATSIDVRDSTSLWTQANAQLATFNAQLQTTDSFSGWRQIVRDLSESEVGSDLMEQLDPAYSSRERFNALFEIKSEDAHRPKFMQRPIQHLNELLQAAQPNQPPQAGQP